MFSWTLLQVGPRETKIERENGADSDQGWMEGPSHENTPIQILNQVHHIICHVSSEADPQTLP